MRFLRWLRSKFQIYSWLVYPHGAKWKGPRPMRSDLHETAGLPGNWALDFMAPGGTTVLAVQDAVVSELSGHDPKLGEVAPGIFGWNVYLETPSGIVYFYTHLGSRKVKTVGQKVRAGDIIGIVGHWPGDEPRSHTHLGVTHPMGKPASKDRIFAIAAAKRVTGRLPKLRNG